jgi:signal-transduction protein with cAMP-binding, CBS, and nucleotidyltransferase domain
VWKQVQDRPLAELEQKHEQPTEKHDTTNLAYARIGAKRIQQQAANCYQQRQDDNHLNLLHHLLSALAS